MQMKHRIAEALKAAMKDRAADRLSTLRLINAAIKDREIALRGEVGEQGEGPPELSDAEVLSILGKMVKQRQESARAYEEGGRVELAEKEREEIAVIEEYLPRQLDAAEIDAAIDAAIAESGAASIRDMGKVMALLKSRHAGQMDFGAAGARLKARLG